jgi:6-phosphogluconolactonase
MNLNHSRLLCWTIVAMSTIACEKEDASEGSSPGIRSQALTVFFGTYTRGWACPPPEAQDGRCTSKGIYRARFDAQTGSLGEPELAAESDNPSYLTISPDGRFLYAVNEVGDFMGEKSGAVTAFAIEGEGSLRQINQLSSRGADPCHISVTRGGTTVLVANYSGGNVSSYRVGADGSLSHASTLQDPGERGPHMNQDAAHAHYIQEGPTAGLVYVADLGLDKVFLYDLNAQTSELAPHAAQPFVVVAPPGSGPRHLAIHPSNRFLYTNNELTTAASVFARDPATGRLEPTAVQTTSTIPLPFSGRSNNAEMLIAPGGKFLYVSNRGHDSIATFAIDQASGKLQLVENVPSGGKEPRDFKFDPSGKFLLAAHQISDDVVVFGIDGATGKLTRTATTVKVSKVVNVAFWEGRKN